MVPQLNFSTVIKFVMELSFIFQGASMVYMMSKNIGSNEDQPLRKIASFVMGKAKDVVSGMVSMVPFVGSRKQVAVGKHSTFDGIWAAETRAPPRPGPRWWVWLGATYFLVSLWQEYNAYKRILALPVGEPAPPPDPPTAEELAAAALAQGPQPPRALAGASIAPPLPPPPSPPVPGALVAGAVAPGTSAAGVPGGAVSPGVAGVAANSAPTTAAGTAAAPVALKPGAGVTGSLASATPSTMQRRATTPPRSAPAQHAHAEGDAAGGKEAGQGDASDRAANMFEFYMQKQREMHQTRQSGGEPGGPSVVPGAPGGAAPVLGGEGEAAAGEGSA